MDEHMDQTYQDYERYVHNPAVLTYSTLRQRS